MKIYFNPETNTDKAAKNAENTHVLQGDNVKEEEKHIRELMKDKPFKEKFLYYFGYYKFAVLGVCVGLGVLISIIYSIVTTKDYAFLCMIINASNLKSESISESFAEYCGIDTENFECLIDAEESETTTGTGINDAGASTRFMAYISSHDLDCAVSDSEIFFKKAINLAYKDVRDVLSPEDISLFEDRFYYIDFDEVERLREDPSLDIIRYDDRGSEAAQLSELKKHMDPSGMKKPVPVGIVVTDSPLFTELESYPGMFPVFGFVEGSQRIEKSIEFLHFLYDTDIDYTGFLLFDL